MDGNRHVMGISYQLVSPTSHLHLHVPVCAQKQLEHNSRSSRACTDSLLSPAPISQVQVHLNLHHQRISTSVARQWIERYEIFGLVPKNVGT